MKIPSLFLFAGDALKEKIKEKFYIPIINIVENFASGFSSFEISQKNSDLHRAFCNYLEQCYFFILYFYVRMSRYKTLFYRNICCSGDYLFFYCTPFGTWILGYMGSRGSFCVGALRSIFKGCSSVYTRKSCNSVISCNYCRIYIRYADGCEYMADFL